MLCTNLGKFVKHTESSKVQLVLQFRTYKSIHKLRHQVICSGNLIIQLNRFYFIYICTLEAWHHSLSNGGETMMAANPETNIWLWKVFPALLLFLCFVFSNLRHFFTWKCVFEHTSCYAHDSAMCTLYAF